MANRGSNRRRNEWTVELLGIAPEDRVLELGFGPGLALVAAARRAARGRVTGIDHSAVMVEQARRRLRQAGLESRVELRLGGLEQLATLAGPFDKIFSVNVVMFVPDKPALFARLHGLLAAGGRLATAYLPRHRGATAEDARRAGQDYAALMRGAGLADVTIEELPLKPVPAVCVVGARAS
jgi:cyclopropane fatty-acyl-phospholipid synthase-like methyltransferase